MWLWDEDSDKIKPRSIYFLSVGLGLRAFRGFWCKFLTLALDFPPRSSQDEDRDKQLKQSGARFNPPPILFARINSPNKSESRTDMEEPSAYTRAPHQLKVTGAGVKPHSLLLLLPATFERIERCRAGFKQDDGSTGSIWEQTTPKDGHTSHCRGRMAWRHSADMHTFTGH